MPGHVDILDERETLGRPFLGSVALHGLVVGTMVALSLAHNSGSERFGDPNSLGGGAVGITPVSKIPLPAQSGLVNPVANDTESRVPTPPPKPQARERVKEPEKDAIPIKSRQKKKRPSQVASSRQKYRPSYADRSGQLYSASGQAMTSPLYGTTGSGGVGVGKGGSPFGTRYGWYEQIVRERVARAWRTQDVDPRVQAAPIVIATFEIQRDGSIRNLLLLQRSGMLTLDNSAMRAVMEASPFPPLPTGYEKDSAKVELWFELKR